MTGGRVAPVLSAALLAAALALAGMGCTSNPCHVGTNPCAASANPCQAANPCHAANPCQAPEPPEQDANPAEPVSTGPPPPPPGHNRWRFVGDEGALRLEETVKDDPWVTIGPDGTIRARVPPSEATRRASGALAPGRSGAVTVEHGR